MPATVKHQFHAIALTLLLSAHASAAELTFFEIGTVSREFNNLGDLPTQGIANGPNQTGDVSFGRGIMGRGLGRTIPMISPGDPVPDGSPNGSRVANNNGRFFPIASDLEMAGNPSLLSAGPPAPRPALITSTPIFQNGVFVTHTKSVIAEGVDFFGLSFGTVAQTGEVAFSAIFDDGNDAVFLGGSSSPNREMFRSGTNVPNFGTVGVTHDVATLAANSGRVMFGGQDLSYQFRHGIFRSDGITTSVIAADGDEDILDLDVTLATFAANLSGFPVMGIERGSLNEFGTAAFVAETSDGFAIFTGNGDTNALGQRILERVADTSGEFTFLSNPTINNESEVAFYGETNTQQGIFKFADGEIEPVLRTGETVTIKRPAGDLEGIVEEILPAQFDMMNDVGQLAFSVKVEGVDGDIVVRADPLGSSPDTPILPPLNGVAGPGFVISGGGGSCGRVRLCYVDPDVAVGYDYSLSEGAANFAAVLIADPLPNGDDTFTLEFEGQQVQLIAGERFAFTDFVSAGVDSFSIFDIDISEMLDPENPTAFVTGVSFVGERVAFDLIMTPRVETVVPLPPAVWLFATSVLMTVFLKSPNMRNRRG